MSYSEYKKVVLADLTRLGRPVTLFWFLRCLLFGGSIQYIFWLRTCKFACSNRLLKYTLYPFARIVLRRYRYKFGIDIHWTTDIGPGFYISHFGGVVVNPEAIIGRNCNISQGVTIGQVNRGPRKGSPRIGDNVYIAPGAKLIGSIVVGTGSAVGANSVVTKDVPAGVTVAGVPSKVISDQGSKGYVGNLS